MYNYRCAECNDRFDPGELIGGICMECAEKQRMKIIAKDKIRRLVNAPYEQLEFDFGGNR